MIDFKLYLVTGRAFCAPRPLESVVDEACAAGVRAVQLREKDLSGRELHGLAVVLRDVTRRRGSRLLINDRADVALGVGAEGVHCPESGLPVGVVRGVWPSKAGFGEPQGLEALSVVARGSGVPVLAIGGITPENAPLCLEKGAAGVGVISAVLSAGDVPRAVQAFRRSLGGL